MRNPLPEYIRTAPVGLGFIIELASYLVAGVVAELVSALLPFGDDPAIPLWTVTTSVGLVMSTYHAVQRYKQRQQDRHDEPSA